MMERGEKQHKWNDEIRITDHDIKIVTSVQKLTDEKTKNKDIHFILQVL